MPGNKVQEAFTDVGAQVRFLSTRQAIMPTSSLSVRQK
jgi:hypothetical protein